MGIAPQPGTVAGIAEGPYAVQIRVDSVAPDLTIEATVVLVGEFFGDTAPRSLNTGRGFILGETLTLKPRQHDTWAIVRPMDGPWHTLAVLSDGSVTFEHYR